LSQNSLQPGATLRVRASLEEYGIPVDHRAAVRAELQRPDNTQTTLTLVEVDPGIFEATTVANLEGVYRFRVLAAGVTMRGVPFTRESLLSGAVILGGDNPPIRTDPSDKDHDRQFCNLLECLLRPEALGRVLKEHNVDPEAVRGCVEKWCAQRLGPPSEGELRRREGVLRLR
jgi:hypothetical protein